MGPVWVVHGHGGGHGGEVSRVRAHVDSARVGRPDVAPARRDLVLAIAEEGAVGEEHVAAVGEERSAEGRVGGVAGEAAPREGQQPAAAERHAGALEAPEAEELSVCMHERMREHMPRRSRVVTVRPVPAQTLAAPPTVLRHSNQSLAAQTCPQGRSL